ncbi:MAG: GerW family sporulation protein [Clostridium fessum]
MADNQFASTIGALFQGMDEFVTTKTVVGEPVTVGDAIILPLVDVTCGMAAGAFGQSAKEKNAGGMSAKMTPSAVLVIQNGMTKRGQYQASGCIDQGSRHGTGSRQ